MSYIVLHNINNNIGKMFSNSFPHIFTTPNIDDFETHLVLMQILQISLLEPNCINNIIYKQLLYKILYKNSFLFSNSTEFFHQFLNYIDINAKDLHSLLPPKDSLMTP